MSNDLTCEYFKTIRSVCCINLVAFHMYGQHQHTTHRLNL